MNSDIWLPLQENLKKITTVCIYDRAGLGMSDPPSSSTTKPSNIPIEIDRKSLLLFSI
jgi:hypothetical protein